MNHEISPLLLLKQISMNVLIFSHIQCMTAIISYVFLSNFAREISVQLTRPKLIHMRMPNLYVERSVISAK